MRYARYAILIGLLSFSFLCGFSQTVFVTNTLDGGPGSFRQALLDIPVIRTIPYIINFNLPGTPTDDGMRTIRLRTKLPWIPSNVIIDGSSQNWPKLGASGAKIILEPEDPNVNFNCLTIGDFSLANTQVSDVEIYGLYIKDFARINNLQTVNMGQGSGIVVDSRANNIKIGAPGKGNVIGGNINGIQIQNSYYYTTATPLTEINIRSNFIGVTYDGKTAKTNVNGISANLYDCSLGIGGDNADEGNVISANQINVNITRNNYSTVNRFNINVVGNKIGTNQAADDDFSDLQLFNTSSALEISGLKVNAANTNLYVRNNTISGNRNFGVSITNSDFVLAGNSIGTGVLGTESFGNGTGVKIELNAVGKIGGDTPASANKIAYNNNGIESVSSRPVTITRNSMYCNKDISISKTLAIAQPYVQILVIRPDLLSGKATPNSTVELFYTDNCEGKCEGKTYFATVTAQADGRWSYPQPTTGKVTATATLLNLTTSPFSIPEVFDNEVVLKNVTCLNGGLGSISVPEPREGISFTWNKVLPNTLTRQFLSNAQSISNLEVGTYELITNDGCRELQRLPLFEIKDQRLTNLNVAWPQPSCGQINFAFSGSVDRGEGVITYEWIDVITNQTVRVGKNVTLPEGTYKLKVTDQAGCSLESASEEIKRLPSPIINLATRQMGQATCGESNGYIRNITVTDIIGTATYRWYVMNVDPVNGSLVQGAQVGTNKDLEGVPGGIYMLEVKDEGTCPAVRISYPYLTVTITNSVIITSGTPVSTTCNNNNGAINGIVIVQGTNYKLTAIGGTFEKSGTCTPGTPFNISDLPAGNYTLNASNAVTLCTAVPRSFTITATPILQYTAQVSVKADASCGLDNGMIRLVYPNNVKPLPGKYHWENAAGQTYPGTSELIERLPEGTYELKITDPNGCTSTPLGPYVIERIPLLIVDKTIGLVTNDQCALGRGSVTRVKIEGGLPLSGSGNDAVYRYAWKDPAGNIVGTGRDLVNIGAGVYYLEVTDQTTCGFDKTNAFTIAAPVIPLATPVVNSMRVCYATEIMLPVVAPEEGTYQLYMTENDATPLMETTNGRFIFKVSKTGDYVIRRKLGSCYSDFTAVHIEVTNDNLEVKNTMTPNGDGMNDYWMVRGLPDHADINIKVYTRSGQLVYESIGPYNKPFDGRFRGKELPAGAYYYKIDLRADCKPLGGSITLLR